MIAWSPAASRRLVRWSAIAFGIIGVLWLVSRSLSPWIRIGINGTDSLPGHVFLILKTERPRAGELIAFRPPDDRRFYRWDGAVFVKIAAGTGGDRVTWVGRDFFIDGRPMGTAKIRATTGEPLSTSPAGVIPAGHYFVWTPHPDSYDSRYSDIGWIAPDRVIGRAVPLL